MQWGGGARWVTGRRRDRGTVFGDAGAHRRLENLAKYLEPMSDLNIIRAARSGSATA